MKSTTTTVALDPARAPKAVSTPQEDDRALYVRQAGNPTGNPNTREGRIKELDGWRALSVLLVIIDHFSIFRIGDPLAPHHKVDQFLQDAGPLGVRVFFVISGFVICRLMIVEESRYGVVTLRGFYLRRAFRILPPFGLYLAAVCLLFGGGFLNGSWRGIASGALFLCDLKPASHASWLVSHTWSLAVEEQFYLVFPALWVLAGKTRRRWIFPAVFFLIASWSVSTMIVEWDRFTIAWARIGFACISCGVLFAVFENRVRSIAKAVPALVMAAVAFLLIWHPVRHNSWIAALYYSLFVPLALVLLLSFSLERAGWFRAFLCWKPVQAVGVTSYGIYLWQQLFTAPAKTYTPLGTPIGYMLPLLFAIIPLSYLFIEKPAMRFGRFLADRVRPQTTRA